MNHNDILKEIKKRQQTIPLVGRGGLLGKLRAALTIGIQLIFLVEERPGACAWRMVKELAADDEDDEQLPLYQVSNTESVTGGFPNSLALASLLSGIPDAMLGVIAFRGLYPLLLADHMPADSGDRGPSLVATLLSETLERCEDLQVLICCSAAEYRRGVTGTPLERALTLSVPPLSSPRTAELLGALAPRRWPGARLTPSALARATELGDEDPAMAQPGATLRLLDQAMVRGLAHKRSLIRAEDVGRGEEAPGLVAAPAGVELCRPGHGLKDVVLPAPLHKQTQELLTSVVARPRLESWGFGRDRLGHASAALFWGKPGTGKTYTAEAVAQELGRPLCRADVAGATSKWLGESEKIIKEIFAYAAAARAVLLIDEADSLLGRRTALEHSGDRWANSIVNQLLQEVERFQGLVVLTTNLEEQLDPALLRRMSFKLEFPLPNARARRLIWRRHLPPQAPLAGDVDLGRLSRDYALSGGLIRNAVMRAAVKAASGRGQRITMARLRRAAEEQLGKQRDRAPAGFAPPPQPQPARPLDLVASKDTERTLPRVPDI